MQWMEGCCEPQPGQAHVEPIEHALDDMRRAELLALT
jgi:hypothetical protein